MTSYLNNIFTQHIPHNLKCIVECGSMDCGDTLKIASHYNEAIIHAFECNPFMLKPCLNNANKCNRIKFYNKALWSRTGTTTFRPVKVERNRGASSVYKLKPRDKRFEKNYQQEEVLVECIALDDLSIAPELLLLDAQESEIEILKGATKTLSTVKYIITEVCYYSVYDNDYSINALIDLLKEHGFKSMGEQKYSQQFGDMLFIK